MFCVSGVFIEELRRQLHECGASAGLNDEVVADQRAEEGVEMRLLRVRKSFPEFVLLPGQQPTKLIGVLGDRHCEGLHAPGREERDHFRP